MHHHSIFVYVWYATLPVGTSCLVSRAPGKLLLTVSTLARNLDVVEWVINNLSTSEQNELRAAFGCGPVGTPLPDRLMEGPVRFAAPEGVRVYRMPELQAELGA